MSSVQNVILVCLILTCCSPFIVIPAQAFTADSLDISIAENGDAVATFRFTLEGILENSVPQSILEEELKKGLTTSSDPPELKSMDRSSAVLLMKKFADTQDVPTGTEYRTTSMDFKKAEIALQNSALSSVVSADFSPEKILLVFPDSYQREFFNVDVLPAVSHIVIDPSRTPQTQATITPKGILNVTSSPEGVKVFLDGAYLGEAPAIFPEVSTGSHTVEFTKDGYESAVKSITVLEGKTTGILVVLRYIPQATTEGTEATPWFTWLLLAIVLIAVAGGGYYFWSEKKKREIFEKETEEDEEE